MLFLSDATVGVGAGYLANAAVHVDTIEIEPRVSGNPGREYNEEVEAYKRGQESDRQSKADAKLEAKSRLEPGMHARCRGVPPGRRPSLWQLLCTTVTH
jgi:hypothetical protein